MKASVHSAADWLRFPRRVRFPLSLCLSFHADTAKHVLPFEVHDTFWDSRGGVEGGQEFLSEPDGLHSEYLEGQTTL